METSSSTYTSKLVQLLFDCLFAGGFLCCKSLLASFSRAVATGTVGPVSTGPLSRRG